MNDLLKYYRLFLLLCLLAFSQAANALLMCEDEEKLTDHYKQVYLIELSANEPFTFDWEFTTKDSPFLGIDFFKVCASKIKGINEKIWRLLHSSHIKEVEMSTANMSYALALGLSKFSSQRERSLEYLNYAMELASEHDMYKLEKMILMIKTNLAVMIFLQK